MSAPMFLAANQNGGHRQYPEIDHPTIIKVVELPDNGIAVIRLTPFDQEGAYLPELLCAAPHPAPPLYGTWEALYERHPLSRPGHSGNIPGQRAPRPASPAKKPRPSFLSVVQ